MISQDLITLFNHKDYEKIVENFSTEKVVDDLKFMDSLRLSYRLLYNAKWDEDLQKYAIQLIIAVKSRFCHEWKQDWRLEAYLGTAYDVVLGEDSNYDRRYEAFKRAFEMAKSPPPELIIALASCFDAPGVPPLSYDEAVVLAKKSFEIEPYSDAAGILCSAYFCMGVEEDSKHWGKIRDALSQIGKRAPPLEPEFIREGYK